MTQTVSTQKILPRDTFPRVIGMMELMKVDALLVVKPENVFYVSGFNPVLQSTYVAVLVFRNQTACLILNALRAEHAKASTWIEDIRVYGQWATQSGAYSTWKEGVADVLRENKVKKIGFEDDFLPIADYWQLQHELPDITFCPGALGWREVRMIKTPLEIENFRIASQLASEGLNGALRSVGIGNSEQYIVASALTEMNKKWITNFPEIEVSGFGNRESGVPIGFSCFCLSGQGIRFNCDSPANHVPLNELLMVGIWGVSNGYCAEIERTVVVGKVNSEIGKMYSEMVKIRKEGFMFLKPGKAAQEVYREVAKLYEEAGYEKYIPGRMGHGLGLGAHEFPSIGDEDSTILEPGMVITFEPNLRIPTLGGAQHSDTVLITNTGYEVLTYGNSDEIFFE